MKLDLADLADLARDEAIAGEETGLTQILLRPAELTGLVEIAQAAIALRDAGDEEARATRYGDLIDTLANHGL